MGVRLVAYLRVSQEDERPENQEYAVFKWAAERGFAIAAVERDIGISGAVPPGERPGWQAVLKRLEAGEARGVVVYALDRIARSLWELAAVYKQFAEKGWALYSVREEWLGSIDDKVKPLIIAVLGWAGEMEREFIRTRTREALARLRAMGKRVGRPPTWTEEKRRRLIDLVARGLTLKEACKLVNVSYNTARKKLARDPEYMEAVKKARLLGLRHRAR